MFTAEEVLAFKKLYQQIKARRGSNRGTVTSTWINLAFSYDGVLKLEASATAFTDVAFKEDLYRRTALLGDPTDTTSPGYPGRWIIGGPALHPDIVVIVASDDRTALETTVRDIARAAVSQSLRVLHTAHGDAPPEPWATREHFGFRDGISQPGIRGVIGDAFLTPRENPHNPHEGKPGQDLVWPGEFVIGYPAQSVVGRETPGPIVDVGLGWARNGSFLVFRRLRQDVDGFWQFIRDAAREVSKHRDFRDMTPEKLAAKFMGRWKSGAPLSLAPDVDRPELGEDPLQDDNFTFEPGTKGSIPACPYAAHIHRANPRASGTTQAAEHLTHRLLRRGIPFGQPWPAHCERGLLFLAYQTSFERT